MYMCAVEHEQRILCGEDRNQLFSGDTVLTVHFSSGHARVEIVKRTLQVICAELCGGLF